MQMEAQTFTVSLSVPVVVPEDMVLIEKVEYEELKKSSKQDIWWSLSQLSKKLNFGEKWITDNILYRERFRKILDVEQGGFVVYPAKKGESWVFQAKKMEEFLENYFAEIYSAKRGS